MLMLIWFYAIAFSYLNKRMSIRCLLLQVAMNYFVQAADAGNANAMAFLGKVGCKNVVINNAVFLYRIGICPKFYHPVFVFCFSHSSSYCEFLHFVFLYIKHSQS